MDFEQALGALTGWLGSGGRPGGKGGGPAPRCRVRRGVLRDGHEVGGAAEAEVLALTVGHPMRPSSLLLHEEHFVGAEWSGVESDVLRLVLGSLEVLVELACSGVER